MLAKNPFPSLTPGLTVLVVASLAGCGGGDRSPPPPESDPVADFDPNVSTVSPRESLTEADFGDLDPGEVGLVLTWTQNRISREHDAGKGPARLVGVTTRRMGRYDRVVFAFSPHIPGYRIHYMEAAGGGCDGTQRVTGAEAFLTVDLELAQANEDGAPLVRDRTRGLGFPALTSAIQVCDEEHKVRWLLGAAGLVDYRVMEMRGEPRLIVDLVHPEE